MIVNIQIDNAIIICTSNYKSINDIKQHLGDPIYYRIGKFIEYVNLTQNAKVQIIDVLLDKKYCELDDNEKALIDTDKIKLLLQKNINAIHNVRHISTLINDYIDDILVRNLLND